MTLEINAEYIKSIRKKFSLSQEQLAQKLSLSIRTVQNWEAGGVIPKTKHEILRELANKPATLVESNAEEIIPSDDETIVTKAGMQFIPNKDGSFTMMTPHITEYGYGGYLNGFSDEKYVSEMPTFPVVVGEVHRGVYRSITMKGESMDDGSRDSIAPGDVVTGRLIQRHLWDNSALHYKRTKFFIIHHLNGILVKSIADHDVVGKRILIHSLNPDKEAYPDVWIDLNQVVELFSVIAKTQKM